FQMVASTGGTPELAEDERAHPTPINENTLIGRMALKRALVHIPDVFIEPNYTWPSNVEHGVHTIAAVPIFSGGEVVGAIGAGRFRVEPYSAEELRLFETFADQAAIAIENVRLFNETKESLAQQTAVSEVLASISGTAFDLDAVFRTVLERARDLCEADHAMAVRRDGAAFQLVAYSGGSASMEERFRAKLAGGPFRFGPGDEEAITTRRSVHLPGLDLDTLPMSGFTYITGSRTRLAVPLVRDEEVLGLIILAKASPDGFTPRQIDVVETFAKQAVIATENVRLFNETKEALDQQTAIGGVLETINTSQFDQKPVLETVVRRAAELCEAQWASVAIWDGAAYVTTAWWGPDMPNEYIEIFIRERRVPEPGSLIGRTALLKRTVHIPDVLADKDYLQVEMQRAGGYRSVLGVPLIRDGFPLGVLVLTRNEPRPYNPRQIQLVETFAQQAVIAIENVRLFNETKESLEQQTAIAEVLGAISASPTDVGPVLDTISRSAARICDATFAGVMIRQDDDTMVQRQAIRRDGLAPRTGVPAPIAGTVSGKAMEELRPIAVDDILDTDEFPAT
ncbi:MAG TPA: GAF domain-containing protein, partial [Methylomirabilota bacterium]|nr:GAF domain-containing protein [Methylomirabilota bacterium]